MMKNINLKGRDVSYELVRKNVKNINIRIKEDGYISVSANPKVPLSIIEEFFTRKSYDILKILEKAEITGQNEEVKNNRIIKDGSIVYYLGNRLTVVTVRANSCMAVREGDKLVMYCPDPDNSQKLHAILEAWYDSQLAVVFRETGRTVFERFRKYVPNEPEYTYRKMKTLWGSCNPVKCRMTINKELIKYDPKLIEFVFCHEYTHFIHPNHSSDFYGFLSDILPDHYERREKLKKDSLIIKQNPV